MTNFIKYNGQMMPMAKVIKLKAEESEKPKTAPKKAVAKKTTEKKDKKFLWLI